MHFNKFLLTLACLISFFSLNVNAADNQGRVVIIPLTGFSDSTPVSPVGGNYYTTVGSQRLAVFERAAFIWSTILNLDYNITLEASFESLYCTSGSATLGYAGPNRVKNINKVWYATAQANQIQKTDTSGTYSDIYANFNSDIDYGCYSGAANGWYYGFDNNPPAGKEALLDVVLHEIAHGLGFLTFVNADTGAFFNSYPDSYTKLLKDTSNGKLWTNMTNSERISSFRSNTLFWAGVNANTFADSVFPDNSGYINNEIRLYNPSNYSAGSSVSHISTYASPNQLMEPFNTNDGVEPVVEPYMLKDMGYKLKEDLNNDAPMAIDYSVSTPKNSSITLYPMNNTTDLNGDTVNFYRFTKLPSNGSIDPFDPSPTYVPDSNYVGVDTIQWETYDVNLKVSNVGTITINVGQSNTAPIAVNDSFTINEDENGSFAVLTNDTDDFSVDSSTLKIETFSQNGSLSILNGLILYTPNLNFNGSDSFTYTVKDDSGLVSNIATVNISVLAINDAPIAISDSYSFDKNSSNNLLNVLLNDSDVDNSLNYSNIVIVKEPVNGTIPKNLTPLVYTPASNFSGNDGFTYYVTDGITSSQTVNVYINVVDNNTAPVSVSDSFTLDEDSLAIIFVLNNDSDDNDVSLSSIVIDSNPSHGVVNDTNGKIVYTPNANYNGTDVLSYSLVDEMGAKGNTVNVTLIINEVNDSPLSVDDSYSLDKNTSLKMTILSNDSDIEDGILSYQNVSILSTSNNGTLSIVSDGVIYTPNQNYSGTDSFVYQITDSNGASSVSSVSIEVTQSVTAPSLTDGGYSINEDETVDMNVFDWLTLGDYPIDSYSLVSNVSNGILTQNNNIVTYTPNQNFFGEDFLVFNVIDTEGNISNNSTIVITVNPVNDLPVVNSDYLNLSEDTSGEIFVLNNDSDIENDLDFSMVSITGQPTSGTLEIKNDHIKYTPNPNFTGADAFLYTVTDLDGGASSALVYLFVENVLDNPVVNDSSFTMSEDEIVNIDLDLISTQGDFSIASYTIETPATNGTYTLNNSILSFTPDQNFYGVDGFVVYATDTNGNVSENANISITIENVNDAPFSTDDDFTVSTSVSVINILDNDFDIDNNINSMSIVIDRLPVNGNVSVSGSVVSYKANNNTVTSDNFDYYLVDPDGAISNISTVSLTIIDETPPVAYEDFYTLDEDSGLNVLDVSNNDSGSRAFSEIVIYSSPNHGLISIDGLNINYTPDDNFSGNDEFHYYIKDTFDLQSNIVVVNIVVNEINDAPISFDDTIDVYYNSPNNINFLANDIDENISSVKVVISKNPSYGSISEANGVFSYTPFVQFDSNMDSFEYYLIDENGITGNVSVVNMNIVYDISSPTTSSEAFKLSTGEVHELNILINDKFFTNTVDIVILDNPTNSYISNSVLFFESNVVGNFVITYKIIDELNQESNISSIFIETFDLVETLANTDQVTLNEDSIKIIDVLSNDTFNEISLIEIVDNVEQGILEIVNNSFKYTPFSNYSGNDSFVYRITDIYGGISEATVNITIIADNSDFNSVPDVFYVNEDEVINIDVLFNDLLETNSSNFKINIISEPRHGHANVTGYNTITYNSYADYHGKDVLTYTVTDLNTGLETNVSDVSITVFSVNDAPSAIYDFFTSFTEIEKEIDFIGNDMDIDSEISGYSIVSHPSNGRLLFKNSKVYYVSDVNFEGDDSFSYYIFDSENKKSNISTVDIRVNKGLNYVPSIDNTSSVTKKKGAAAGGISLIYFLLVLPILLFRRSTRNI